MYVKNYSSIILDYTELQYNELTYYIICTSYFCETKIDDDYYSLKINWKQLFGYY